METKSLVSKLVTRLRSSKKHGDAAQLAEYHLGDYQLAGQCLIDGLFFREAWALAYRHNIVNWAGMTAGCSSRELCFLNAVFLVKQRQH